ncbi:hypothetical protein M1446_02690 [Candidatus Dependentiae bacterium]|nr:hypothetical protein [Candidatus Dependentiae bacterium]
MKKILTALILNLMILQSYANEVEEQNTESNISTFIKMNENIAKKGAFVVGSTLGLWGLWGSRHHFSAIREGYILIYNGIINYTKDKPVILAAAKYTLPLASLTASYYLIKYSQKKNKERTNKKVNQF